MNLLKQSRLFPEKKRRAWFSPHLRIVFSGMEIPNSRVFRRKKEPSRNHHVEVLLLLAMERVDKRGQKALGLGLDSDQ